MVGQVRCLRTREEDDDPVEHGREENWEGRRGWEVLNIYWEFVTHALRVGPCEFRYPFANLVISSEQKSKQ